MSFNEPESQPMCSDCKYPQNICSCGDTVTFTDALYGKEEQTYYDMFDSMDSDEVVKLLRMFHQYQSVAAGDALAAHLTTMLEAHIQTL